MLLGLSLALLACEALFRLLPVAAGVSAMAVNEDNPVFRFEPGTDYLWSVGWNFEAVNRGRTNRQGFVNDQDYDAGDERPLLAVVGDSYVEALMAPYAETLHGRLACRLAPRARVYSFGASGAPLSQYLAWVRHARDTYWPHGYAIVVVGNTSAEAGTARLTDSRAAVDAFLEALPAASGLAPEPVALLVDAIRPQVYEGVAAERAVAGSYFALMRGYFIAEATARGFTVIDLTRAFRNTFRATGEPFEFRSDFHWNSGGHAVAAGALETSRVVSGL